MIGVKQEWIERGAYWLHIEASGKERRFEMSDIARNNAERCADDLVLPSLAVSIVKVGNKLFEETTTRNRGEERKIRFRLVKPRGEGWVMFDDSSDQRTVWRRRIKCLT
jgi:hypothetical protein